MRSFLLLASFFIGLSPLLAQIQDPVDLEHSVKRISDTEAELQVKATLDEHWHIYATDLPEESFVIATEFNLTPAKSYQKLGKLKEPKPIEEYDPNFQEVLRWHEKEAVFSQRIKVLSQSDFTVKVEFVYQTCNEEMCLPPEYVDLEFAVKGAPAAAIEKAKSNPDQQKLGATEAEKPTGDARDVAPGVEPETLEIDYAAVEEADSSNLTESDTETDAVSGDEDSSPRSMWGIFIIAFLGGFAALLTPCVFPMIPLTVSFFTKQSKSRAKGIANAMLYGVAIIVLYTFLGWLITWIFGSDALNALSTNPYINIFFFIILVVFAISFFGAFEIRVPSSWINRSDRAADKGGVIGIFFMALTLALVSFSCTGPIIGGLLAEAASGGVQGPLIGMFGFSLALAMPFTLFAIFPGWLNSLPKSGGWLNSVKVVLGFIELAFAFKFLSNADLVWDAGILLREHFIAIWIAIGLLMVLYLLGSYRMPHDSPTEKVSVFRLILSVATLTFVVYLIPGLWGAPLKLISGFPPPMFYAEAPGGFNKSTAVVAASDIPEGAHPDECPHGLNCFHDFETAKAYAKKVDKPILIDFTGKACVNCRKMEEQVWIDPKVLEVLRDDVVLVSLYVDDQKDLPEEEQFVSAVTGKKIKTIGNKWSEFQVKHYQTNSQPQYVFVDHHDLEPLIEPTAYDPDIDKYLNWLQRGIKAFEQQEEEQ